MEVAPPNMYKDESANKGLKLKGRDDAAIPKSRDNGRIMVSGSFVRDDPESDLRKHFASCGEITNVYILKSPVSDRPSGVCCIDLIGKGAVDKALKLNKTRVRASKVVVQYLPETRCQSYLTNYSTEIGRIIVSGYESSLPLDDVVSALKKHFASCGEVTDVFIRQVMIDNNNLLESDGYVYLVGEGAVAKALKLSGTDVGGWKVFVTPDPDFDDVDEVSSAMFEVEGYDSKLSEADNRRDLSEHFSSCGEIEDVWFICDSARVTIEGKNVEKEGLKLNGSYMGGRKLVVKLCSRPSKCTVHNRVGLGGGRRCHRREKKAKLTTE